MLIMLGVLAAALVAAPPAQAEPYSPLPTSCTIDVPVHVAGKRVVFEASVDTTNGTAVTGTVEISVARGGGAARAAQVAGGREVWETTARYDGDTLRVVGPRLRPGQYIASMRFTPDNELYGSCTDAVGFRVGAAGGPGGDRTPDAAGLPNTGGPHLTLLLLGLGLVAVGGGVAVRARATA
ncbi:hypothetical protein [Nocardioides sp. SYSU DS0651]|uniref:hypothetical protein n=1 Tax=Nocardioides sp. SYSU DS0651 TaxID=3415955 RepID=UPI003F4B7DEB